MKQLLLMRHAKSDWNFQLPDKDRPLSERGVNDAPQMGKFIYLNQLVPDKIICSTSRRTRETLKLMSFPGILTEFSEIIYDNQPDRIHDLIASENSNINRLMIIGHNPSMEEMVHRFILNSFNYPKYSTSGLSLIEFSFNQWSDIITEKGKLVFYTSPKLLKK
jgi:phosphohistidine phosphatase